MFLTHHTPWLLVARAGKGTRFQSLANQTFLGMVPLFSSLDLRAENPGLLTAQQIKSTTYYSNTLMSLPCGQDTGYHFAAVLAYPLATSGEYVLTLSLA